MVTRQSMVRGVVLVFAIGAVSAAVYWAQRRTPGDPPRVGAAPSMAAPPAATITPNVPAQTPQIAPSAAAVAPAEPPPVQRDRAVFLSTSKAAMAPVFDEPEPIKTLGADADAGASDE